MKVIGKSLLLSVLVALVCALAGLAQAQPEPWRHPDGTIHYYRAVAVPGGITWAAAGDSARIPGGYLATPTSPDENDFVFNLADSNIYWHLRPGPGTFAGPWLGGFQPFGSIEPESGWQWVSGEPFDYRNWSPGEPDNSGGNENALHLGEAVLSRIPTWDDLDESDSLVRSYVLELSADSTTVGLTYFDSSASPGYNLFAHRGSHTIYLIDNKGRVVHNWHDSLSTVAQMYLLEDGSLLHVDNLNNLNFLDGGRVEELDWNSNVIWSYNYSDSTHMLHHDVMGMPNGNVMFIAWELKSRDEAIAAGRDTAKLVDGKLWPEHIVEVDPATNNLVWEWHVWDHLRQDYDSTKENYGAVTDHPELVDLNYCRPQSGGTGADWIHANALDYNPEFDQLIFSACGFGEVWIIDHSTTTEEARGHIGGRQGMGGDLLYRWGNPQTYRAGDSTDQKLYWLHDPNWIKPGLPGAGHILAYNNGWGRIGGNYSSVDEFIPPVDGSGRYTRPAPGQPYEPAGQCWIYAATPPSSFYGQNMSGAQRLPNGNTLTGEGTKGRFREVSTDSQLVWSYMNPETDSGITYQGDTVKHGPVGWESNAFRTVRYPPDYPGLAGHDLTPGYPIELYRPPQPTGIAEGNPALRAMPGACAAEPNPFRTTTAIHLAPPSVGRAGLVVYDALGRTVRMIIASSAAREASGIIWDGTDDTGRPVSRGVYYCRLLDRAESPLKLVKLD